MAVSSLVVCNLSAGDDTNLVERPCVLTDVVVTELTGAAPAAVLLSSPVDGENYMALSALAGQSFAWHGAVALPGGLNVLSQMGDVAVTVGYY